jgi:sulfatase modifying factor 1
MRSFLHLLFLILLLTAIALAENQPTVTEPAAGIEVVFIKGGCYQMGNNSDDDNPAHEVCVNDFSMGRYEVTQGQWKAVMGGYPAFVSNCGDDCPVQQISWDAVQKFIAKLNQTTGKQYRLPTEAEWEYAARSNGTNEKWAGTGKASEIGEYAWYSGNSEGKVHPVGKKKPNGPGLFDMSGNVWEWMNDWYDKNYYRNSPKDNPPGPGSGTSHVLRGGSWSRNAMFTSASVRNRITPGCWLDYYGFRLVRTE